MALRSHHHWRTLNLTHSFSTVIIRKASSSSSSSSVVFRSKPKIICSTDKSEQAATGSNVNTIKKEDIVIVGAGIAGLATAVALQSVGIGSVVLEQGESLRTGGASLTFFKNGWKVLDALGVGSELRTQFLEIQGMEVRSSDGRRLRSFNFKDEDESQEVRPVERKLLLETLASKLPEDSIYYSSKLKNISQSRENDETILELEDGSLLHAKVVIACDGTRSPVAKWMGFQDPRYVGQCAFRGLAFYPNGQPFESRVTYVYGTGVRAGYVPISRSKVYWFICYNSPSPGPKVTDASILRQEASNLIKDWPYEIVNILNSTPDDTITKTPLVDRWLWPGFVPPASKGKVVLVGDAWHPMTPNLGQGACCALEDSVVLVGKLAQAIKYKTMSVEDAFGFYARERWPRIFPITVRSNLVGSFLQLENGLVCSVRDNVIVPKVIRLGPMLEHTNFSFEPLG